MNEKLNIQDLIDLLAEKHGMSKKDADSFVKEFFLLVEESLEKDKYVKIKGLGTFKLIDVESRESVNVNTGERIEIQGHTKVTFTPEPSLKEVINRPFSHFETVVLNENTVLEDTLLENENENDEEEEVVSNSAEISPTRIAEQAEVTGKVLVKDTKAEEMADSAEGEVQEGTELLPQTTSEVFPQTIEKEPADSKTEAVDSPSMKYFIGIVVFVVALCGGAVVFMYYPDLLETMTSEMVMEATAEPIVEKPADETALADTLSAKDTAEPVKVDTVAESLSVIAKKQDTPKKNVPQPVAKKEQKKPAAPFVPDSVGYTIVGTEATYTIKEGETLTKVALRFYGTNALWPYIVKHNPGVIKNPDNVPFGTTIKIPKLAKKQ